MTASDSPCENPTAHALTAWAAFSRFVVDELPGRYGYDDANAELLELARDITRVPEDVDCASLDVNLAMHSFRLADEEPPSELRVLATRLGALTGKATFLTYEDLIFVNPRERQRTLTRGDLEPEFYMSHRVIERLCARAARDTEAALDDERDRVARLDEAEHCLAAVVYELRRMRSSIDPAGFGQLRDVLTLADGHPAGPSGRFSTALPILDALIAGDALDAEHTADLVEMRAHFPRAGMAELDRVKDRTRGGRDLASASRTWSREQRTAATRVIEAQHAIRAAHFGAVRRLVPATASGGTGGITDVESFLRHRQTFTNTLLAACAEEERGHA